MKKIFDNLAIPRGVVLFLEFKKKSTFSKNLGICLKLLGFEVFKTHNFNPGQFSSSLSIRAYYCIYYVINTFF